MGFRLSKSIRIVPGIRLNVSSRGIGYSVGGKGMRITRHANGRVSRTLSLPGTGLSHHSTIRPGRPRPQPHSARNQRASALAPTPPRPTPGMFAPGWEKDLFAVLPSTNPSDFTDVARRHHRNAPHTRVIAATLEGLLHFEFGAGDAGAESRARELLGWAAVQPSTEPIQRFTGTYLVHRTWPVEIVPGVTAELRLQDDVVRLAAAELHQRAGDLDAAIWTVEQALPTAHAALSLIDLYSCAERHQEVIDLTNGITNSDDATALLLALRGRAFAHQGFYDAARESFSQALRVRSRSTAVRHRALVERVQVDFAQNRKAAARKGLEKILAEDPTYPGLTDALSSLQ